MLERDIIIKEIIELEEKLLIIEKHINSMEEDELYIENTKEYAIMVKMIKKLNALNSALVSVCV